MVYLKVGIRESYLNLCHHEDDQQKRQGHRSKPRHLEISNLKAVGPSLELTFARIK